MHCLARLTAYLKQFYHVASGSDITLQIFGKRYDTHYKVEQKMAKS